MCVPVAVGIMAGAALVGGVMNGMAAKDAAEANADAARRNAELAQKAADAALQDGEQDAAKVVMQGEALEGAQRTGYAAGGVVVDQGSAAQMVESTEALTAIDVETIRNNAQREAWGLRTGAANMLEDASAMEDAGQLALWSGIIGGVGSGASTLIAGGIGKGAPKAPGKG